MIYACGDVDPGHRHSRVDKDFALAEYINWRTSHNTLSAYHTRIASLRTLVGKLPFFGRRLSMYASS